MRPNQETVPDALVYFLEADDTRARINSLTEIYSLAGLSSSFYHETTSEEPWGTTWLSYDRGGVSLRNTTTGCLLEFFEADLDSVDTYHENPTFILSQGNDDVSWTVEVMPNDDLHDVLRKFEYLTDIFYMNPAMLYQLITDSIIYEGKEVPDGFTLGALKILLER